MLLLRLAPANKTADAPALISSPMSTTSKTTPPTTTSSSSSSSSSLVDVKPKLPELESQTGPKPNARQHQRTPKTSSKASVIQTSDNTSSKRTNSPERDKTKTTSGGDGAASARLLDLGKKLIEAARSGKVEQVRQLVEEAGAPFSSDWLGTTALHVAAQSGHYEIAEILVRGGVNREARTKMERTALHLAAQSGSLEIVDLLLNSGSNVNCCDMLRMTPLHWAIERGHALVAGRLVMAGANVFACNKFLLTPIDIARESGSYEMLELFRNLSIDINLMGKQNYQRHHQLDTLAKNPAQILAMANAKLCNDQPSIEQHQLEYHPGGPSHSTGASSLLEPDAESCLNLAGFEWNKCDFDTDFFLTSESGTSADAGAPGDDEDGEGDGEKEDDEGEPKVEYLMRVVEKLQEENQQLRQKVEQLSTVEP